MNIRPMTDVEKRSAAKAFVETWLGRGDEKQDAQNFWRMLLSTVYGVVSPESDVLFEYPIKKDVKSSTIFIDAYIKDTSVLIEQKGKVDVPPFDDAIYDLLLSEASAGFDWSEISPTIFGAMFESTLNPETRRKGGMHYTSIENIHKVIDPLFLDDLKAEYASIMSNNVVASRHRALEA